MALKLGQFPSLDEKGALTARISKRITWFGRLFDCASRSSQRGLTSFVFHSHSHRSNTRASRRITVKGGRRRYEEFSAALFQV